MDCILAGLLPTLVVAPLYMAGKAEFGAIAQAARAFHTVKKGLGLTPSLAWSTTSTSLHTALPSTYAGRKECGLLCS